MQKTDLTYHNTTLMIVLLCLGSGIVLFAIAQHLTQRWKDRNKPKPTDEGFLLDKKPRGSITILLSWSIGGLLMASTLRYIAEFPMHASQKVMDAVTVAPLVIGVAMGIYYTIRNEWARDRTFAIILMVVVGMCIYAVVMNATGVW